MTEAQLQSAIIQAATVLGWMTFHPYDSRRSSPGWPDLVMVRRGRLIFAELKTEKGRVRPEQQRWIDELGAVSVGSDRVQVYLWRPQHWLNGTVEMVLRGDELRRVAA